jgi:hypothetical protein
MEPNLDTSHDIEDIAAPEYPAGFVPGEWQATDAAERFQVASDELWPHNMSKFNNDREYFERRLMNDKTTADFVNKGALIKNGETYIRLKNANALSAAKLNNLKSEIEQLQAVMPKDKMIVSVGYRTGTNTYGHAIRGDSSINLSLSRIFDNPSELDRLSEAGSWKMPSLKDNSRLRYTLTHEWGHSIDDDKAAWIASGREQRIRDFVKANRDLGFISKYALTKPVELYAEMFAEWRLTNGAANNAFVQAFAKEFGWTK